MTTCLLERIKLTVPVLGRYPEFPLEETLWPDPQHSLSHRVECTAKLSTRMTQNLYGRAKRENEGDKTRQNAQPSPSRPSSAQQRQQVPAISRTARSSACAGHFTPNCSSKSVPGVLASASVWRLFSDLKRLRTCHGCFRLIYVTNAIPSLHLIEVLREMQV